MPGFAKKSQQQTAKSKSAMGLGLLEEAVRLHKLGEIKQAEYFYHEAIRIGVRHEVAYSNLGAIYKNTNRQADAVDIYRRAIEVNPFFADAHVNLGSILKELGKLDQALAATLKAIELKPDHAEAYLNLGSILKELGKPDQALAATLKAIELKPDYAEAHLNLGKILKQHKKLDQALAATSKAIELKPDHSEAYVNLGGVFKEKGELEQALAAMLKAIELKPNSSEAQYGLGTIKRAFGDIQAGDECFREALKIRPEQTGALYELSMNVKEPEVAIQLINHSKKIRKNTLVPQERLFLDFALSNCYHLLRDYSAASQHLKQANQAKLLLMPSNAEQLILQVSDCLHKDQLFPPHSRQAGEHLIFIVGMPRSGSTLLERVLSMNHDIHDLGDSPALPLSIAQAQLSKESERYQNLENLYLSNLRPMPHDCRYTVDKNLHNFRFVGIIASQLPNARIIHCRRNPLDNILSMFRANLGAGNNYAASVTDSAKVLIAQEIAMREYSNRYNGKIYHFDYDSFVNDPKSALVPLLEWLGLDWADQYLNPEANTRPINTASVIQARSPITNKSLNGWLNYRSLLAPAEKLIRESNLFC